ncbi:MAG: iron-sulfur cluster assembly protein, partial [Ignavibacteriota bacterium]
MAQISKQELEEKIIHTLKSCYDPEIPVDIFELGLIYEIAIDDDYNVKIKMTLTS